MFNQQYKYIRLVPHRNMRGGSGLNVAPPRPTSPLPTLSPESPKTSPRQLQRTTATRELPKYPSSQPISTSVASPMANINEKINEAKIKGVLTDLKNRINTQLKDTNCCYEDIITYGNAGELKEKQREYVSIVAKSFAKYKNDIMNKYMSSIEKINGDKFDYKSYEAVNNNLRDLYMPVVKGILNDTREMITSIYNGMKDESKGGFPHYKIYTSRYLRQCKDGVCCNIHTPTCCDFGVRGECYLAFAGQLASRFVMPLEQFANDNTLGVLNSGAKGYLKEVMEYATNINNALGLIEDYTTKTFNKVKTSKISNDIYGSVVLYIGPPDKKFIKEQFEYIAKVETDLDKSYVKK